MQVVKRDGSLQEFDRNKVKEAISKAFDACECTINQYDLDYMVRDIKIWDKITIEEIQDIVIETLRDYDFDNVADAYKAYKDKQSRTRLLLDKIAYMESYINSSENAATMSNTDGNANTSAKNVATLEPEVFKDNFRDIQRYRMKKILKKLYPEVASQYERDLNHHIIYTHDEASTPTLKQYCMAVSLYPLMLNGCGILDKTTPSAPNDIQSFSGQLVNSIFTLSSQCKGAVAVGSYFIALNYYIIAEYGPYWYTKLDVVVTNEHCLKKRTLKNVIQKAFKTFVLGINQPAGNRGYQSPFVNVSYYDHTYFDSLFGDFYYPDGTKPEWEAVDALQRLFMNWFNEWRLTQLATFPVETFAMVHDGHDIIDKEYKDLCAEMYAKGHSFFTYISDSADSLASCCRLRNELAENTFNPTSGLTGIKTGSCNVITLNINRIVQDWAKEETTWWSEEGDRNLLHCKDNVTLLKKYLINILERVYKYHIAYKTMLYEWEDKGAYASSNGDFIHISDLYSTVGLNGINESAEYLGLEVSNNPEYFEFLQLILGTVKEQNKLHSIHDKKRPFLFNSEVVPAESLGGKNYNWDKKDGYIVPEDRNLYNSYFYNAHDDTSVLDKFILHGRQTSVWCDGGSAAHINLENHLSKEQYLKLIDFAVKEGTNYFTFNIPNSKCEDCGFITKHPITECPKCHSDNITQYTRIIGYLRPITAFGKDRRIEAEQRTYSKNV
jgi:ribonucleoside-triphosphate reductase|nr:MAG TPA: anaerobic ribonucleoside triphosphate reductase [Bacteriophage sp.]